MFRDKGIWNKITQIKDERKNKNSDHIRWGREQWAQEGEERALETFDIWIHVIGSGYLFSYGSF